MSEPKKAIFFLILLIVTPVSVFAGPSKLKMGMPPAMVVVEKASEGMMAPQMELVGTVYYRERSDIASETSGRVNKVLVREGARVRRGDLLVQVDSELLKKSFGSEKALYEEALFSYKRAKSELTRKEELFREKLISENEYDEARFSVLGLEMRAKSILSNVEKLKVELIKKNIRAPYNGMLLNKYISRGEWLSPGKIVAGIADDSFVDVTVNVPQNLVQYLKKGMKVEAIVSDKRLNGRVFAIIPSADIATRTFPVKIRARNNMSLREGMDATVRLPQGRAKKALVVNRDAVVSVFGNSAVFAIRDGKAVMVPVKLVGYRADVAGIYSPSLVGGTEIVIKGNERLRSGQTVIVAGKDTGGMGRNENIPSTENLNQKK